MLKLLRINRNIRSIRRYLNIVRVLSTYGFDQALEMLGLADVIVRSRRLFRLTVPDMAKLTAAERMRLVLEELGPTFIKLGQILSTRPDVIPRSFVLEFEKLQDNVPSFSFEEVQAQLTGELGGAVDQFYAEIDPVPLAAASIAQVHRARLKTGEDVVIKVRRPGIVEIVESDISALLALCVNLPGRFAERWTFLAKGTPLKSFVTISPKYPGCISPACIGSRVPEPF